MTGSSTRNVTQAVWLKGERMSDWEQNNNRQSDFLTEKIKVKPVNKRKLLRGRKQLPADALPAHILGDMYAGQVHILLPAAQPGGYYACESVHTEK